eukprot:7482233-Lingulodinium_polyedra.AAC.1
MEVDRSMVAQLRDEDEIQELKGPASRLERFLRRVPWGQRHLQTGPPDVAGGRGCVRAPLQ